MDSEATTRREPGSEKQNQHFGFIADTSVEQFRKAMLANIGYAPDNIIGDGSLHRCKDNNGKLNGAYVIHLDKWAAGYFECFKQGIKQTWKMSDFIPLSDLQRIEFSIEAHQAKQR